MTNEPAYYHAVALALGGDPGKLRKLQAQFHGAKHPWKSAFAYLAGRDPRPPDPDTAWRELTEAGIRIVFLENPDFPLLLREIHHPPIALYCLGSPPGGILGNRTISIVGTRRATTEGKDAARQFGREFAEAGVTVASGLALGIDAAAHQGCLSASGRTVAVLACGLDRFYPGENDPLARRILAEGGSIISEYPPGQPPYPARFLERNRIVCGISAGVLIIEAPRRSGSLATAAYAREQNRDLFVIPGPIAHPNFFGSHALIRQGAELVTKPGDILAAYGIEPGTPGGFGDLAANGPEMLIFRILRGFSDPADIDKIIETAKLEPRIVNRALSVLLLKNMVRESDAGYIIE